MESFVGLLRNSVESTNIDVELYFRAHDKLILKLEKIDPSTLDFDTLNFHKARLSKQLHDQLK